MLTQTPPAYFVSAGLTISLCSLWDSNVGAVVPHFSTINKTIYSQVFLLPQMRQKVFFPSFTWITNCVRPAMMMALRASQLTELTVAKTNWMQSEVSNSMLPPRIFTIVLNSAQFYRTSLLKLINMRWALLTLASLTYGQRHWVYTVKGTKANAGVVFKSFWNDIHRTLLL